MYQRASGSNGSENNRKSIWAQNQSTTTTQQKPVRNTSIPTNNYSTPSKLSTDSGLDDIFADLYLNHHQDTASSSNRQQQGRSFINTNCVKTPSSATIRTRNPLANLNTPGTSQLREAILHHRKYEKVVPRDTRGRLESIQFQHDPELDSTPFVYHKTVDTTTTTTTTSSSKQQKKPTPSYNNNPTSLDGSLFGIGEFHDVFITDEDLKRAQEKGEQEKTNSDIALEVATFLMKWNNGSISSNSKSSEKVQASLYHNFVEIGRGFLWCLNEGLEWSSVAMHPLISTHLGELGVNFGMRFELPSISGVRSKTIEGCLFLLLSFDEGDNLQFGLDSNNRNAEKLISQVSRLWHNEIARELPVESETAAIEREKLESIESAEKEYQQALSLAKEKHLQNLHDIEHRYQMQLKQAEKNAAVKLDVKPAINEETPSKPGNICKLCYDEPQGVILEPCRHSLCITCLKTMESMNLLLSCPWDRQQIDSYHNII